MDSVRLSFNMDTLDTHHGLPRPIKRDNVYCDVLETYEENLLAVLDEFPFRIRYENEQAYDTGGVCRDMFSAFWEEVYLRHFDGERLLVPAVRPGMDISKFKLLGTILAHGFMVSGFLPVRIAFPVLAAILLGTDVNMPDNILLETFVDFLSVHELREAIIHVQTESSSLTPQHEK